MCLPCCGKAACGGGQATSRGRVFKASTPSVCIRAHCSRRNLQFCLRVGFDAEQNKAPNAWRSREEGGSGELLVNGVALIMAGKVGWPHERSPMMSPWPGSMMICPTAVSWIPGNLGSLARGCWSRSASAGRGKHTNSTLA